MARPAVPISILAHDPACNPACGACQYKELTYPEQLTRKQAWAEKQLGRWRDVLATITPAPETERLGYRAKSWMRARFEQGEVSFGMTRSVRLDGRWEEEFISWNTCPLHVPAVPKLIAKLRRALMDRAPAFAEKRLEGIWLGAPHLVLVAKEPGHAELAGIDWAGVLAAPFDRVWFHANSQVGRKIFGHHPIERLAGPPDDSAHHPIRAFRQVAQSLLEQARARAVEALLRPRPALVVDLYCGTGDLSLRLPPETGWLGIELAKAAAEFADSRRAPDQAPHAAFVGTVEHRLADPRVRERITGAYSLFLNPPRPGLSQEARAQVAELIRARPPEAVVYLSCSASSLARDLELFTAAGYRVTELRPFDFFPQTEHFETLAVLAPPETRENPAGEGIPARRPNI